MPNICLTIAYKGTNYAGWQRQKNAKTIQGEIEKVLNKISGEKIKLIASGRTDSGVHAKAQVANFYTQSKISPPILQRALNAKLPKDISIVKIKKVSKDFHSRFCTKSKIYRYTILNGSVNDPFSHPYYHKFSFKLNTSLMKREAACLLGKHDFKSFQAKASFYKIKSTIRTIKKINIKKEKNFICLEIEANGFLYNMVRNIMGTLIEIGRGYLPPGSMKKILDSRDRGKAGPTAPAKGLTLEKIFY